MDESTIVGLITGTRAYPQDDLSLESKASTIFHALSVVKNEMESLVTKGFMPFREFASKRKGHGIKYICAFPDPIGGARVNVLFTKDTRLLDQRPNFERFICHSVILTAKGDLFWLDEQCETNYNASDEGSIPDVVGEVTLFPLDVRHLEHRLKYFPELFSKLLISFRGIAEQAFAVRELKQEHTKTVLDELTRVNTMVGLKSVNI